MLTIIPITNYKNNKVREFHAFRMKSVESPKKEKEKKKKKLRKSITR